MPILRYDLQIYLLLRSLFVMIFANLSNLNMDSEETYSTINETYKIWKKHSPFLYSLLQTYELPSCSQTLDWMTDTYTENDWKIATLLMATNSIGQNSVYLLNIGLPTDDSLTDYTSYRQQRSDCNVGANGYVGTLGAQAITIKTTIPQASQVLRTRVNRFDQNFIAVRTGGANSEYIIYDLRNKDDQIQANALKLNGHSQEGFGLAWSPLVSQHLLSGSYDRKILLYNIDHPEKPQISWECSDGIQDVKWSNFNSNLFASAHQQQKINLWDMRTGDNRPFITRKAHTGQVYSLDFNKKNEFLLISGGQDGDIQLWDIRNISKKLHTFIGHNDAVNSVTWSPHSAVRFASASSDRRSVVWDLEKVNVAPQKSGSQIMFIHGGHRSKICQVSWSREKDILASSQQNNILHVWKMTDSLLGA